jgi:hypothetical protein
MEATPIKKVVKKKAVVQPTPSLPPPPSPSMRLYRRIAVTFVAITFLALAAVVYLSFSRATVHVTPEAVNVETSFVADVVATPLAENEVEGRVVSSTFEQAKSVELAGEGNKPVEGKAGGMVTIYNNGTSTQPLVATTRLLTPDGILFRIDSGVTVPAGGSVQVMAHADVAGATGDIGPTKFTIPGLSQSLQALIYAESTQPMVGGVSYVRVVTQEDLDAAAEALRLEILEAAKSTLRLTIGGSYTGEVFFDEILERKSDTEPGEETGVVVVSIKLTVVGVFFQREDLLSIAEGKLYEKMPSGMEVVGVNADSLQFTVVRYDVEQQLANVSVTLVGSTTLSPTSSVLDRNAMLGKSPNEVKANLEASDAIKSVDISFTPFWLQRMPTLKDHIHVIIE